MMRVTLLGTGSPEPYRRRASSGYLIDIGQDRIMFDCGGGVVDRLLQADVSLETVSDLFFSHLHSDHMMDYARLVHARWDMGADQLCVHGPAPVAQITGRMFGKDGVFAADLTARTESPPSQEIWRDRGGALPRPWPAPHVIEIKPGFSTDRDGWRLSSVEVPHAQPYLESMAFRIDSDGQSMVYSGDSGPCPVLTHLAKGADLLIHMCFQPSDEIRGADWLRGASGHLEVARTAAEAGVAHVVLTHLRPEMDRPGVHERLISEMRELYSGRITIGEDLMSFELGDD